MMDKRCINHNSIQVKELSEELGLKPIIVAAKIAVWQDKNNTYDFPSANDLVEGINYSLKAIDILLSDKAKQIFDKGNKNGWDLNKILTELAIPKEQKALLLDLSNNIYNVWHASDKPIDKFIKENVNNYFVKTKGGSPRAVFFTANKAPQESFLSKREYHKQFSVKMENPFIADYSNNPHGEFNGKNREQVVKEALENGHDGVIWKNIYDNGFIGDVYISLNADNINSDLREQLALELVNKYGYSVEVKTTITSHYNNIHDDEVEDIISPDSKAGSKNENTSYYSNLTVPGGTNYTENEISTPLITPSIKGHAQFATDKGIGWFRSDDMVLNGNYENKEEQDFLQAMIEESPIFAEGAIISKTRRILEVQSDLFQKGRDKEDLILKQKEDSLYTGIKQETTQELYKEAKNKGKEVFAYHDYYYLYNNKYYSYSSINNKYYVSENNSKINTSENQFLQLLKSNIIFTF